MEKVQYNFNPDLEDLIDFSVVSIQHAQLLANFFVDEARLSPHRFNYAPDLSEGLINKFDSQIIEVKGEDGSTLVKDMYLFE